MNQKISEMELANALGNTDLIPIVQNGINKTILGSMVMPADTGWVTLTLNDGWQIIMLLTNTLYKYVRLVHKYF